ncbi:unnamed protein product [Urochloa humidicola]
MSCLSKAVERFRDYRVEVSRFFHFGWQVVNNLSHALVLKDGVIEVMFPVMIDICKEMCSLEKNSVQLMLAPIHGQV